MGKLEIKKGNLFLYKGNLAHGVNCAGAMGKGIAVEFKNHFPAMYQNYKEWCKKGNMIPGSCWAFESLDIADWFTKMDEAKEAAGLDPTTIGFTVSYKFYSIYNLAIKSHWSLPASYGALKASLENMAKDMIEKKHKEVAMPWIGCNLGGLKKEKVREYLEKTARNFDIDIIVYEPEDA